MLKRSGLIVGLQDHYGVIIVQMENEEVDLDECPPGGTICSVLP